MTEKNISLNKKKTSQKRNQLFRYFFAVIFILSFSLGSLYSYAQSTPSATTLSAEEIAQLEATRLAQEQAAADRQAELEAQAMKDKISQKNSELEDLKKQIDTYEKQLQFTQKEAKTLQTTVKSLDLERQKMSASINLSQKQLETTSVNIEGISLGIEDTEERITRTNKAVSEILRAIDRADSKTFVEAILSNKNFSEILDEQMQLMKLREDVRRKMNELANDKKTLLTEKDKVELEKKKIINYKETLKDQKAILDTAKKEKSELLAITKDRESDYQKILNANIAKKEAFEKELDDYTSKLTRQLDNKYIPSTATKILAWPLDRIIITQHFGRTKDSVRLYASGTHNGMDFSASRGTPVKSPARGIVVATGDTDQSCPKASYGKWVLVRHDNGLTTLFGHFDVIKVSSGQSVETGDLLGYSGNTGYSTGPHVHLTVFASDGVKVGSFASKSCTGRTLTMPLPTATNAYLDPEAYLPKA